MARRLLGPSHRVSTCMRHQLPGSGEVAVHQRKDGATYYQGLMTCGNVWACPVCAAKISERRRVELVSGIAANAARGGEVALLTLTVPHHQFSNPVALVDLMGRSLSRLWGGRAGKQLRDDLGLRGNVRALEVTYGEHGWHPHFHILLFLRVAVDLQAFSARIFERWARCVEREGLGIALPEAFKLQDGQNAGAYAGKWGAGKWGLEEELSKAAMKQGRRGGRTPFALLRDARGGDHQAGHLFVEFVEAFRGRSQLRWSKGLRAELDLGVEKTDEMLAAGAEDEPAVLLGSFSSLEWRLVCRHGARGHVLEILRSGVWNDVKTLLKNLGELTSLGARLSTT